MIAQKLAFLTHRAGALAELPLDTSCLVSPTTVEIHLDNAISAIDQVFELINTQHPLHQLPTEVLVTVMRLAINEDSRGHKSPVIYSHVCRRWRLALFADQLLWTHIKAEDPLCLGYLRLFLR
jgi:hypothetical protein